MQHEERCSKDWKQDEKQAFANLTRNKMQEHISLPLKNSKYVHEIRMNCAL